MSNSSALKLSKYYPPYRIALIAIGVGFVIMVLGSLLKVAGMEIAENFAWMAAGSSIMLFAIFNCIFSLFAPDPLKNWGQSFASFIMLLLISGLLAWAFSGNSIREAGSFTWIFMVLSVAYLIFMSMVNVMKQIVEFAMKEEWQHPRIRNKKRK